MTARKADTGGHSQVLGSNFGFDWAQSMTEGPLKIYENVCKHALAATSRCLETQAAFARKLSECKDPTEALACQREFSQKMIALGVEETSSAFEALQLQFRLGARHG
mgnify:CR=1 FL=1